MSHTIIYDISQQYWYLLWLFPGVIGLLIGIIWFRIQKRLAIQSDNKLPNNGILLCAISILWMIIAYVAFIFPYYGYIYLLKTGHYQTMTGRLQHRGIIIMDFDIEYRFMIDHTSFRIPKNRRALPYDLRQNPAWDVTEPLIALKTDPLVTVFYVEELDGTQVVLRMATT